jgi:ferritin
MLNKKIEEAVNRQINAEMYSSYLYLAMNAWFESRNLKGFANWMKVQCQEELVHAMRFYDYVASRGGEIRLMAIEAPPASWESPLAAFEDVLKHEIKVTSLINDLASLALTEKDHASSTMLQWFVTEQVEEEANASDLVWKLKMIGSDGAGLFMIDRELATRVFVPPPPAP